MVLVKRHSVENVAAGTRYGPGNSIPAAAPVPTGPGLGVTYDWDFIDTHRTALHVFE